MKKYTKARLGVALTPHRFRNAAFTSIALDDPAHVTIGVALLGHARIETGEWHYNLARTDSAVRSHYEVVKATRGTMRIARMIDAKTRERARDMMLAKTDSSHAPWHIVRSDDKRRARLNCISHILDLIPYAKVPRAKVKLPKRSDKRAYDDQEALKDRRFVRERY